MCVHIRKPIYKVSLIILGIYSETSNIAVSYISGLETQLITLLMTMEYEYLKHFEIFM